MHPRRNIDRMHRRQQAGLCTRCANGVLATSRWLCEACKALRRAADKQLTAMRHKRGLSKRGRPLSAGWLAHLMLLLAVPAFAHDAPELTQSETIDRWEANSHYDETGWHQLDQQIAWIWNGRRMEVADWRLIKSPGQWPQRDWERGGWTCLWQDGEVIRRVTARDYERTWTQTGFAGDPEVNDRAVVAKEHRRGLRLVKVDKPIAVPPPSGPASGR